MIAPCVLAVLALLPTSTEAADPTMGEGYALLSEGEYRKAWARFQTSANENGVSTTTLNAMVRAALPLAEYGVAANLAVQAKQLAKSAPEKVEAATLLGRTHLEASLFSPEHVAAEDAAGIGYLDRAIEQFSEAVSVSPALASEASYWLAVSRLEREETELASEAAEAYLTQEPSGEHAAAAKAILAAAAEQIASTPPTAKNPGRPEYSGLARQQGVKGIILFHGTVDPKGRYNDIVVLKGLDPVLDERVLKQVARWRFTPAEADGQPTATPFLTSVRMTLRGGDPARQVIPAE